MFIFYEKCNDIFRLKVNIFNEAINSKKHNLLNIKKKNFVNNQISMSF